MDSENYSAKRKDYLDYAKAIGIFLVVWGHLLPRQSNPPQFALEIKMLIYSFHMPLFFIITGMGLYYKFEKSEKFSLKREIAKSVKRLLIPYFIWCIVYIALFMREEAFVAGRGERLLFETKRALWGGIAPLWFLHTLFISETVFLCIGRFFSKKRRKKSVAACACALAFSGFLTFLAENIYKRFFFGKNNYPVIMLFRVFPALFFICAGFLALLLARRICSASEGLSEALKKKWTLLVIFAVLAAIFCTVHFKAGNDVNLYMFEIYKNAASFLAAGLTGSFAVIAFCAFLPRGIKPLRFLSRETIPIMALHYPPMRTCETVLSVSDKYIGSSAALCAALATTAACFLVSAFVIRPCGRIVKKCFK